MRAEEWGYAGADTQPDSPALSPFPSYSSR